MAKASELPTTMYCCELPVSDSRSGGVNIPARLCSVLPRNTEVDEAGKRTLTQKNEKTGNYEEATQETIYHFQLAAFCQNTESDNNAYEETLAVISSLVPSGAVNVDEGKSLKKTTHKRCGYNDMGDSCKYTVKRNDQVVDYCKRLFCYDVRAIGIAVTGMQWRGWLPSSPALYETPVLDVLANFVYMHTSIQAQDARLIAQRGRETQKAQARLPPIAMHLHSANTLLNHNIKNMTWADITSHTALNWMSDPSPFELLPVFIGSMIESTFDWGFWIVLAIMADFFETPAMDVLELEQMFADTKYKVPVGPSKKTREWLSSFGIGEAAPNGGKMRGEVLFKIEDEESSQKSALYITSKWDEDMVISSCKLAFNIASNNVSGGGGGGSGGASDSDSALFTSMAWKLSQQVASVMFLKYTKSLNSACNINSPEDLGIMIFRYMDAPVCYPKFGKAPCGNGFQSWNGILASLGSTVDTVTQMQHYEDSAKFVDGHHKEMQEIISKDNYSYNIAPWTLQNRGGSIFSFGVEPRFLMLARAIIGTRSLISQTSVQSIFDHFVVQTIKFRIPSTLYPYCSVFTGLPDCRSIGLSLHKINEDEMYKEKPATLFRALPCGPVAEMCGECMTGVMPGGIMVEDVATLNKYHRVCAILDIEHDALHMENLTPPMLPFYTWVYAELVHTPTDLDHSTYDATDARYNKILLFVDPKKNRIARFTSINSHDRTQDRLLIDSRESTSTVKFSNTRRFFNDMVDAVAPSKKGFVRYAAIYNRPGTLLYVKHIGYLVLSKWDIEDTTVPSIVYPTWLSGVYLNPNNMSYRAVSEELDLEKQPSFLHKLQNVNPQVLFLSIFVL